MKKNLNFRIFAGLGLILLFQTASAQTKREILEEDPKLSPNLRLELTPLNLYALEDNSMGMWSVRSSYRVNNQFAFSGEFRKEYYDEQDLNYGYDNSKSYGKAYNGYAYELIGTYFFATKEREVKEWVPIKQKQVGYNTVEVTVDPMPISRLALYGVRLGYGGLKMTSTVLNANISEVNNPSNKLTDEYVIPMETMGTIYAGLNATRIKNVKVKYPVYGTRRKQYIREFYADFMYAASNKFGDVVENTGTGTVTYHIDETPDLKKAGFRAGVFSTNTGKLINLGYGLEAGVMPYLSQYSSDYYINFRIVISLFKKVGLSEE